MLLQRESKRNLRVMFTQDGGNEHAEDGLTRDEAVRIRESESRQVALEMGIDEPRFLRHKSLEGEALHELTRELLEEIRRVRADAIFTPFVLDTNIEHRNTNFALSNALREYRGNLKIFGYEVWALTIPNVILNIDSVMHKKRRLLALYKSQLSGRDYINAVTGLNMYHTMKCPSGLCKYAECFFEIPSEQFIHIMNVLRSTIISH